MHTIQMINDAKKTVTLLFKDLSLKEDAAEQGCGEAHVVLEAVVVFWSEGYKMFSRRRNVHMETASCWKERTVGVKSPPSFEPKAHKRSVQSVCLCLCVCVCLKRHLRALLTSRTGAVIGSRLRAFGWRARWGEVMMGRLANIWIWTQPKSHLHFKWLPNVTQQHPISWDFRELAGLRLAIEDFVFYWFIPTRASWFRCSSTKASVVLKNDQRGLGTNAWL